MYERIRNDLYERLKSENDFRLTERRLNIGKAFKQLRDSNRIRLCDLVKSTGLKRSCLNTLIHLGETNTSQDRFQKIVEGLRVPTDEFIHIARQTAQYNFFPIKKTEGEVFKYRSYEVKVLSPLSFNAKDFLWCHVRVDARKRIADLSHPTMDQVAGLLTNGHLKFTYGIKSQNIHTNQAFFFDPKITHSFENESASGTADFYLMYRLKPRPDEKRIAVRTDRPGSVSAATLIDEIRKELSPDPNRLLPMPELAALSGIDLSALMHLSYRKTKIIPFEKIDVLASLTDHSFEHIIQKAENRYQGWVKIFTDLNKTVIDLSLRQGVSFTSHTSMGIGRRKFSVADVSFESWNEGGVRKKWEYQGLGFMGIAVQRGQIGVHYGRQPLFVLEWGDTLYLNADIPITFVNLLSEEKAEIKGESEEAKAILFSSPAIF